MASTAPAAPSINLWITADRHPFDPRPVKMTRLAAIGHNAMHVSGAASVRMSGRFGPDVVGAGVQCSISSLRLKPFLARSVLAAAAILGLALLAIMSAARLPAAAPKAHREPGRLNVVEPRYERDFRSRWNGTKTRSQADAKAINWSPDGGLSTLLLQVQASRRAPEASSAAHQPTPSPVETDLVGTTRLTAPLPVPSPLALDRRSQRSIATIHTTVPDEPRSKFDGLQFLFQLFNSGHDPARTLLVANPQTAIYDISNHIVYMPDGKNLEAHSGFGHFLDDPSSVDRRDQGPTPPNFYKLSLRPTRFHGVQALRMTPVGDGRMFGRNGFLAHPYMLGDDGASNGCLSVRNYDAFLRAYQSGEVKRVIVLPRLDAQPARLARADVDRH